MTRADDRFVAVGNLSRDRLGNRVDRSQKVHDQRSAVKKLINIQQHAARPRLGKRGSASFHRFSLVTLEPSNQQLILVGGRSNDSHR